MCGTWLPQVFLKHHIICQYLSHRTCFLGKKKNELSWFLPEADSHYTEQKRYIVQSLRTSIWTLFQSGGHIFKRSVLFPPNRSFLCMNNALVTTHINILYIYPSQVHVNTEEDPVPNHRKGKAERSQNIFPGLTSWPFTHSAKSSVVGRQKEQRSTG